KQCAFAIEAIAAFAAKKLSAFRKVSRARIASIGLLDQLKEATRAEALWNLGEDFALFRPRPRLLLDRGARQREQGPEARRIPLDPKPVAVLEVSSKQVNPTMSQHLAPVEHNDRVANPIHIIQQVA